MKKLIISRLFMLYFISTGSILIYTACDKVEYIKPAYAIVETSIPTNITKTSVDAGGNIKSDGGSAIRERGVKYSTSNENFEKTDYSSTSETGTYTVTLQGLAPNTRYFVIAYAINL